MIVQAKFFEWATRVSKVDRYEELVAELVDPRYSDELDGGTIQLVESYADGRPDVVHGAGSNEKPIVHALVDCPSVQLNMRVWAAPGQFSEHFHTRVQTLALVARTNLARVIVCQFDRRVREHLISMRREDRIALFLTHKDVIAPYNPGAISIAERYWGIDELELRMPADVYQDLEAKLSASWINPVESRWINAQIDFGAGPLRVPVLARQDKGAIIIFSPPPPEELVREVHILTRRQCTIMDWISEGKTSAEVATILEISPRTVEKHLEAVFQRFGVENRVAAVRTYLDLKAGRDPRTS